MSDQLDSKKSQEQVLKTAAHYQWKKLQLIINGKDLRVSLGQSLNCTKHDLLYLISGPPAELDKHES